MSVEQAFKNKNFDVMRLIIGSINFKMYSFKYINNNTTALS